MNGETVAEIVKGENDATGAEINTVYSKISGVYAIYRTAERVMIQYADTDKEPLGLEQRRALAPLNPLRGEINGLVDDWRNSGRPKDLCRAGMFDRRTADALTVALQGDQVHAEELLKAVKADVLEERVSIGRTEYMLFATFAGLAVFLLFGAITLGAGAPSAFPLVQFIADKSLWLAAGMGCLGALFSIALGIRARDIHTDLQRRDNIADAVLRVMIGAVSAIILFSLLRSELVTIGFGNTPIAIDEGSDFLLDAAIIVAFLAGFSERLVGSYLSTAALAATGDGAAGAAKAGAALQAAAKPEVEATEQNPRGRLEVEIVNGAAAGAAAGGPGAAAHGDEDDDLDGCLCGVAVDVEELTDDTELPEATGGIERAA